MKSTNGFKGKVILKGEKLKQGEGKEVLRRTRQFIHIKVFIKSSAPAVDNGFHLDLSRLDNEMFAVVPVPNKTKEQIMISRLYNYNHRLRNKFTPLQENLLVSTRLFTMRAQTDPEICLPIMK